MVDSGIAKKVINSGVGKTIAANITKELFKKAANSAIGRQLQKAVVTGVANAAEKATTSGLQKIGYAVPSNIQSLISTESNRPVESFQFTESKRPKKKKILLPGSMRPIIEPGRKKGKKEKLEDELFYNEFPIHKSNASYR